MSFDSLILYFTALLWVVTLVYWYKKKNSNVGVIVLALYTAIACVSCHLYQYPESDFYEMDVTLFPLLYLYIIIIMLIRPLFNIDHQYVSTLKLPPMKLMNTICIVIIICASYQVVVSLPEVRNGLNLMLLDGSNAVDAYVQTTEENMERKSMSGSVNIFNVIVSTGINFSMLFFFIYLLYPHKNKYILIGMIVALLVTPLTSLVSGSREKVISAILIFIFMFVLLRPFLSNTIRKFITYGATMVGSLLMSLFFIISFARARGEIEAFLYNFERYFAMSFLEFDDKCLYANGTREGNLVSPLINVILGGKTYSQTELRAIYSSLGVDNGTFYTFVGDFVLDYGPFWAFVILLMIAYFFEKKLKIKSSLTIGHVILYYTLLKLLSGFYLHQFPGIGGNLFIIELVLLYIFFSHLRLVSIKRVI